MRDDALTILSGSDIRYLTAGREQELMEIVSQAYLLHATGQSSLPHSAFVWLPGDARNRAIALPAYLGGAVNTLGIKWVSSFPRNPQNGRDRASAVLILNSTETGMPEAILEASLINSKRTAASAAVAAKTLLDGRTAREVGLIGCGVVNFEIVRFLRAACPQMDSLKIFDIDPERAELFRQFCSQEFPELRCQPASSAEETLDGTLLVSIATNASAPHLSSLEPCPRDAVILHISLRDLAPALILESQNVVDDSDHVCRAGTSLHLAEQSAGHRGFITCSLADLLGPGKSFERAGRVIFSPFGLGILDVAMGADLLRRARVQRRGTILGSFAPDPWASRFCATATA